MKPIKLDDIKIYVEQNIGNFHTSRLDKLKGLRLNEILKRKNPYLYKAKNILISSDLIKILMEAYLSSQEEAVLGNFLDGLAIYINAKVYGGTKSSAKGIDLEFEKDGKRYLVTIKSGPNWGNSGQISGMKDDFLKAKRILRTHNSKLEIIAINGCCYGRDNKPDKGDYYKYCGQSFWEFISGNKELYIDLIEPLGHKAKEKNQEFAKEYAKLVNIFVDEFSKNFCTDGEINWDVLLKYNSSTLIEKKKP